MPTFLEEKLKKQARKKGFKGRRAAEYIYGTMNKMGAMRGNKETPKGRELEKKHKRDMRKRRRR